MRNIGDNDGSGRLAIGLYFSFKMLTVLVACFSIYLGYKLFILGVTGKASISVNTVTVKGQLLNAAPGLFFAVGGIVALIIIVYKGVSLDFGPGNGQVSMRLNRR